jgi:hypothetical protein
MRVKLVGLFAGLACMVLASAGCGRLQSNDLSSNDEQVESPFWPVDKDGDAQLSSSHALHSYFMAAKAKSMPTNYFRELIRANSSIALRYGEWPSYKPGWTGGGTIYHPGIGRAASTWNSSDWSSFYNELFHAWWGNVFMKQAGYQSIRGQILTAERKQHYRRAHPSDPLLAQEEAYSETVATLMVYLYPRYNPNFPGNRGFTALSDLKYDTGRTVSPVSHGEQPGYTPEAENTYPNPLEYKLMFQILTDHLPPET